MIATVLIADDTAFMRAVLKDTLQANGYDVIAEATNGLEAVDLYRRHRPDIVTLDLSMPIMDGIRALQEIRAIDPAAKVIVCSTDGNQHSIVKAVRAGAMDYMIKPFQRERLIGSIGNLMKK